MEEEEEEKEGKNGAFSLDRMKERKIINERMKERKES